jgi:hypothetical protein
MGPLNITMKVANGQDPLRVLEGEVMKVTRGGFLRGLVGAAASIPMTPGAIAGSVVKAAAPVVAQAAVQAVLAPKEDPKVAQHKVDHAHVVNFFRQIHNKQGTGEYHRDSDVFHDPHTDSWSDVGGSAVYKHSSGRFVHYDDELAADYNSAMNLKQSAERRGGVPYKIDHDYDRPNMRTYDVHVFDPKSGKVTEHHPKIDISKAPEFDDFEGMDAHVALHGWQKSQINKHLAKFETLDTYNQAITPHLAAHDYTELTGDKLDDHVKMYRQARSGGPVSQRERDNFFNQLTPNLESPRLYGSRKASGGESPAKIDGDYGFSVSDPHHVLISGLDKETGKPSFQHFGPDYETTLHWGTPGISREVRGHSDRSDPTVLKAHLDKHHEGF